MNESISNSERIYKEAIRAHQLATIEVERIARLPVPVETEARLAQAEAKGLAFSEQAIARKKMFDAQNTYETVRSR